MTKKVKFLSYIGIAIFSIIATLMIIKSNKAKNTCDFTLLGFFPNEDPGYDKGASACFTGRCGEYLILAGGCNFPVDPLEKDSKKRYYKGVYIAKEKEINKEGKLEWKRVGELPLELAYGVSAVFNDELYCVGGYGYSGSSNAVFKISLSKILKYDTTLESAYKAVKIEALANLPFCIDNAAGCFVGSKLYIMGGMLDGKASNRVFCLDVLQKNAAWKELSPYPGNPRVQAVAANISSSLYLFGGYTPADSFNAIPAKLNFDGYLFDTLTERWLHSIPGPKDEYGKKVFLGGSVAAVISSESSSGTSEGSRVSDSTKSAGFTSSSESIIILGGVNKDIFLSALNNPKPDYLTHPISWYRFNPYLFSFKNNQWNILCKDNFCARAGASLIVSQDSLTIYLLGGELKPRVRCSVIGSLSFL